MTKEPTQRVDVMLIGEMLLPEHQSLSRWLKGHRSTGSVRHTNSIPDRNEELDADLTIVLQTYSDQFGQQTVNRLIENTLGRRLFCCYGPWCASDGRAFEIWPPALRVPLSDFQQFLTGELQGLCAGLKPLPPTASGEELFARSYGRPNTDETN